jgi:hypothetical protein
LKPWHPSVFEVTCGLDEEEVSGTTTLTTVT